MNELATDTHFDETIELENSLREYKKFFEEATVGLCRIDIKTGRFLMANPYCARCSGTTAQKNWLTARKHF